MYTEQISVTDTAQDLATLLEATGTKPASNKCKGVLIQIDPTEATANIEIRGRGNGAGIILQNSTELNPTHLAFEESDISNVFLIASVNPTLVRVMVETRQ